MTESERDFLLRLRANDDTEPSDPDDDFLAAYVAKRIRASSEFIEKLNGALKARDGSSR